MSRWFLSYHSPDQALAERLKSAIERKDTDAHVFFAPGEGLSRQQGGKELLWPLPGERGSSGWPEHRLFPRTLGPANGNHQLPEGNGVREIIPGHAVVAARAREVIGRLRLGRKAGIALGHATLHLNDAAHGIEELLNSVRVPSPVRLTTRP
jgi:hypothetical protein